MTSRSAPAATPQLFTLHGGTALALHLGHSKSVDFDFFSGEALTPNDLMNSIPYLDGAKILDVQKNSFTCRVDRGDPVKLQFFGRLQVGNIEPRLKPREAGFWVASLLDVAGSKVKVLPERFEEKDYIDINTLLQSGMDLPRMLAAAQEIYGKSYTFRTKMNIALILSICTCTIRRTIIGDRNGHTQLYSI